MPTPSPEATNRMRLQKYLAHCGLCSRRKAELLIEEGKVRINGKTATLGATVDPDLDDVTVIGRQLPKPTKESIVLVMNKPKGYVCSNEDPFEVRTVFKLLPKIYQRERLFCAGRLDKDSEGLLILTNDGSLAHRLTHPSKGIIKRYYVTLNRPWELRHKDLFLKGINDQGEYLRAIEVIPFQAGPDADRRIEVHLQQGRKREIRRLCEAYGYCVEKLKRFQIGKFVMRKIPSSGVVKLSQKEIALLFENA